MRKIAAVVIGLTLTLSANFCLAAEVSLSKSKPRINALTVCEIIHSQMFDGISFTEHQRQRLRDLMQQARYDKPVVNIHQLETMHRLIIAEKFDEHAVRAQAEKLAEDQVARQVELSHIRNQMYQLLTPEQQAILKTRHERRIQQLKQVSSQYHAVPVQLLSCNNH